MACLNFYDYLIARDVRFGKRMEGVAQQSRWIRFLKSALLFAAGSASQTVWAPRALRTWVRTCVWSHVAPYCTVRGRRVESVLTPALA